MAMTVADVLAMPTVRSAAPEVVAGHEGLTRPVRWVHTTELPDIAGTEPKAASLGARLRHLLGFR